MAWKGSQNEAHCVYDKDGNMELKPTLGADHPDEIVVSAASALGRKRLEEQKAQIAKDGEMLATEKIAFSKAQAEFAAKQAEVAALDSGLAAREASVAAKEAALQEVVDRAVQKALAKAAAPKPAQKVAPTKSPTSGTATATEG